MSCVKSSGVTFHNRPQAGGSGLLPRREYQLEVFASVDAIAQIVGSLHNPIIGVTGVKMQDK